MKMTKKTNIGGAYARKAPYEYEGNKFEADIQNGDKIKILSEGEKVAGQYGEQDVFKVETRNGEKNLTFNQKSINVLIDELGEDSKSWVGKEVDVILKKDTIAGKRVVIAYIVSGEWELDDYGELTKLQTAEKIKSVDIDDDDLPPVD